MGFDVFGVKPKSEKGEYFRNNVWWWRPLWEYVAENCSDVLTEEDVYEGSLNDGHLISEEKALKIAAKLKELIASGKTKAYEEERKKYLESLPDEVCDLCHGTGVRNDDVVKGTCNKCDGKGKVRPLETWYPFSVENVEEFAEFCEESGGFEID
jgi:hypothetical protein